jgi:hypothetical protein
MRKIAVINPRDRKVIYKTVPDNEISRAAGGHLTSHNIVRHGENVSYGLFNNGTPSSEIPEYYALNGQLHHGTGVLYAFDQEGRTLNILPRVHPKPIWLGPLDSVETAVVAGLIDKPEW